MQYELWDVISYGHGEPAHPFTLIAKSKSFSVIYMKFLNFSKKQPCVVFVNTNPDKIGDNDG